MINMKDPVKHTMKKQIDTQVNAKGFKWKRGVLLNVSTMHYCNLMLCSVVFGCHTGYETSIDNLEHSSLCLNAVHVVHEITILVMI